MSFRSRSRPTQPLTSRRRSLSSSRAQSSGSYNYDGLSDNGGTTNGYTLSTDYCPNGKSSSSYYQSPYNSNYSSRDNLYDASSLARNYSGDSYYSNGNKSMSSSSAPSKYRHEYIVACSTENNTNSNVASTTAASISTLNKYLNSSSIFLLNHQHHYSITISLKPFNINNSNYSSSYNNSNNDYKSASLKSFKSYTRSPHTSSHLASSSKSSSPLSTPSSSTFYASKATDIHSTCNSTSTAVYGSNGKYQTSTNSFLSSSLASNCYDGTRYASSPNSSNNHYISPYTASYDNGITTASLSFNMGPSYNSSKGSKLYLSKTLAQNVSDRFRSNIKSLSNSNSSLSAYPILFACNSASTTNATSMAAIVPRSSSLIEQERKLRTTSCTAAHRSVSASSEKSEGYESGSETRPSHSCLGTPVSTVSVSTSTFATDNRKIENSGDNIDYKALWEAAKLENDELKQQLKKKDDEVVQTRATLERIANATTKNSLSEIEKRERRAMERKLSELEEELKLLQKLKNENERLRAENRALTRVVSKLTSSAHSQLSTSEQ